MVQTIKVDALSFVINGKKELENLLQGIIKAKNIGYLFSPQTVAV